MPHETHSSCIMQESRESREWLYNVRCVSVPISIYVRINMVSGCILRKSMILFVSVLSFVLLCYLFHFNLPFRRVDPRGRIVVITKSRIVYDHTYIHSCISIYYADFRSLVRNEKKTK